MPFDIQDLTLRLGGAPVLHGITASLPQNGITGIIGANGCGKTTLLRGLAGIVRPSKGRVLHDGVDVASLPPRKRAQTIAMLPQSASAPAGLTVRQLIARGRTPWLRPFQPMSRSDHTAVTNALDAVGLSDLAEHPLDRLSGGQRQRAWIGLVLAQESRTILLDEPLNFLDLPHQAGLVQLLRQLSATRSVVMILHDLTIAARVCDRIIALRAGQLVAFGPADTVLKPNPLRQTFGIDFDCAVQENSGKPVILPQDL